MTDITELAQRLATCAKEDTYPVLSPADCGVLVEALEKAQDSGKVFQQSFFRQSLMYDVVAEAYEEAKEQIAKDVEIKARLCRESNSLFDRLRVAEKRIAELESRTVAAELFTCPRCGRTTTHPEGWHYCHKREAE
ncbi:hypothetical protein [Klebsiella aerogenes]|uniref:hypothetical protein n=1 Tax=Klebsiella aerogenes TaxID=548 RepID=UPI00293126EB|nr:hypothetical protein [Klebsiella aerogenes]